MLRVYFVSYQCHEKLSNFFKLVRRQGYPSNTNFFLTIFIYSNVNNSSSIVEKSNDCFSKMNFDILVGDRPTVFLEFLGFTLNGFQLFSLEKDGFAAEMVLFFFLSGNVSPVLDPIKAYFIEMVENL